MAGKGSAYLGDYLQLRYLDAGIPDEGLRLRRLRSDDLVISYRLMMRNQPELLELVDTAIRYLPPGSLYRDLGKYLPQGEQDVNPLHFTDKEQAWLVGKAHTIKMVADPGFMPYSGVNRRGSAHWLECGCLAGSESADGAALRAGARRQPGGGVGIAAQWRCRHDGRTDGVRRP